MSCEWSKDELSTLLKYYPIGGAMLTRLKGVDKDIVDIDKKANNIGLKRKTEKDIGTNGWDIENTNILLKYYIVGGYLLCKEKGLMKSKISVMARVDQLKLKRFSDFEIEVIKDSSFSMDEKMELLSRDRTVTEVKSVEEYGVV